VEGGVSNWARAGVRGGTGAGTGVRKAGGDPKGGAEGGAGVRGGALNCVLFLISSNIRVISSCCLRYGSSC
jgi:hypothetical protein